MLRSKLVEQGYNKIAEDYYNHRDLNKFNKELEEFAFLLPDNAHILDVGCGAGIPTAKFLTQRGIKVTGIDLSETMLNLARKMVPNAEFIKIRKMWNMDVTPEFCHRCHMVQ